MVECANKCKARSEGLGEAVCIVSLNGQAAAFFWPVERESSDNRVAIWCECLPKCEEVSVTIRFFDHEMKGGPVMPDIVKPRRRPRANVSHDPIDLLACLSQSTASSRDRGRGQIQDGDILKVLFLKIVHQSRSAAPYINDRRPGMCNLVDQRKGGLGTILEPTDAVLPFRFICGIPVQPRCLFLHRLGFRLRFLHSPYQSQAISPWSIFGEHDCFRSRRIEPTGRAARLRTCAGRCPWCPGRRGWDRSRRWSSVRSRRRASNR